MDAQRLVLCVAASLAFLLLSSASASAEPPHVTRTANFVVHAPTDEIAGQVGRAAEHFRQVLAVEWLGHELPNWYRPCTIHVRVGQIGAGGSTTFSFDRGEVSGWRMNVQGSLERVLDSVIPHEVSHTILASYFRQPLPRWADEGAATLAEHSSEQRIQKERLRRILKTSERIPLQRLLAIREYPQDMQQVLNLYAQGYSLADYLVQQGGKPGYLHFVADALRSDWGAALKKHFGVETIASLEKQWANWVVAGSPDLATPKGQLLVLNASQRNQALARQAANGPDAVVRGQSPPEFPTDEGWKAPARAQTRATGRPAVQDPFLLPSRIASAQSPARGAALEAPQPRRAPPQQSSGPNDGRQRAWNDGWAPVAPRRPLAGGHSPLR